MAKRTMLTAKLLAISAVDRPAQEPAVAVILKRAKCNDPTCKAQDCKDPAHAAMDPAAKAAFNAQQRRDLADSGAAMPDGSFPIRNESDLQNAMQALGRAKDRAAAISHIKQRAKALGLTAMLSDTYKNDNAGEPAQPPNITMTPEQIAALKAENDKQLATMKAENDKKLADMTKRAERAEKVAQLDDVQKKHLGSLKTDEQEAFLALAPEVRTQAVAKSLANTADANPVIETVDGQEFRKNDDPRLLKMAKQLASEKAQREAVEKAADEERLEKAAGELDKMPGDVEAKKDLLRAVNSLPVAKQAKVREILKAQNAAMSKAFETRGVETTPPAGSPDATIEQIAKRMRDADPKLTSEQAYTKALLTPEGRKAYAERQQG